MDLKQASDEIRALAVVAGNLPGGGLPAAEVLITAAELLEAAPGRKQSYDEEEKAAADFIKESLKPFKKGQAYWNPPHNVALNETLMGKWNLWEFTILPLFPARSAYSSGEYRPEGIIIQPAWRPYRAMQDSFYLTMDLAKKLVATTKSIGTVQDKVRKEIAWVEKKFNASIPSSVKSKLESEALKTAERRWGANMLRAKKRLIPNDGSKPIDFT